MKVVDISAWQENDDIDWQGLVNAGYEGVIIKIGEYNRLSDQFVAQVNSAVAYGLQYGVYYFAHAANCEEALEEAATVDSWLKTYLRSETPPLGIWYDAEHNDMLAYSDSVAETCCAFVNRMTEYGYTYVGIYAYWRWLSNDTAEGAIHVLHLEDVPTWVPIWAAQYYHENSIANEYPDHTYKMWQYTDSLYGFMKDGTQLDADVYYD